MAVPLSLVGTFGVMYLLDYSLDNLSLMALTISTGFVVDDAIVVTENIARLIEEGQVAAGGGAGGRAPDRLHDRVDHGLAASRCSSRSCSWAGIVGRLFREFAVTLSIAIAISALVSLTAHAGDGGAAAAAGGRANAGAASAGPPSGSSRRWCAATIAG